MQARTAAATPSMTTDPAAEAPRRLFTALFPDAAARAAIDAARQAWGGLPRRLRPAPERMHVTLQFFDAVDAEHERAWRAALAGLRFDAFDITLARAELWHAPRGTIAVLRAAPCPALDALHAATDALARAAGLAPDARPYKPHLTALRQAERVQGARLAAPITWRVGAVSLVWSELQAQPPRYRVLGSCPGR
ncbi:MAG: RNA 2',3'-cyclic phosphodiesterase [Burkholderiales bacterium]|nr:RNA 2',3'-cyclic phosphodiesterase [Burkholderiales bacterium]